MHTVPEVRGVPTGADLAIDAVEPTRPRAKRTLPRLRGLRWTFTVYMSTRLLLFVVALVDLPIKGWPLHNELSNWDGIWYLRLAEHGYPAHVSHAQTTLGFFPLYPMTMWLVEHIFFCGYLIAGLIVSMASGFVATVLVGELARGWWGEDARRRTILFFCLFPGSIVFSMVYTEGLLLALVAGCFLALDRRRWLTAGLLAGAATAVGPPAVVIVPACGVVALRELWRRGWRDPEARRSLLAPLLAPLGIVSVGAYFWTHTGSPFASFTAQRYGWHEKSSPFALLHTARRMFDQLFRIDNLSHPGVNLNYVAGVLGGLFLLFALVLLIRTRPTVSPAAFVWVLGIGFLTLTSAEVPPNARWLINAFPALMIVAYRFRDRAFTRLLVASTLLLVGMSMITYIGTGLRP